MATEYQRPPQVVDDRPHSPVPGHINPNTNHFCTREGQLAPGGQCPNGCDHADHYSNDGHPECVEDAFMKEA
jgi:hypothetical protein